MSTFVVCPDCQGHGGHDKIDGFTGADVDEWYGDDQAAREDFTHSYRAGYFTEPCSTCRGQRVVTEDQLVQWHEQAEDRAQEEAERRVGC